MSVQDRTSALSVVADRTQQTEVYGDCLTQELMNVVGRALTRTPRGGSVDVRVTSDSDGCRVDVTDTGAGLEPDQAAVIFERFARLDAGSAGTGLGLNIVRSVIRLHGGELVATSAGPGKGATFTFELPRS